MSYDYSTLLWLSLLKSQANDEEGGKQIIHQATINQVEAWSFSLTLTSSGRITIVSRVCSQMQLAGLMAN